MLEFGDERGSRRVSESSKWERESEGFEWLAMTVGSKVRHRRAIDGWPRAWGLAKLITRASVSHACKHLTEDVCCEFQRTKL